MKFSMLAISTKSENIDEIAACEKNDMSQREIVMVTEDEEQLCQLTKEAGERGVIDSACSKTVAGNKFVDNYVDKLTPRMKEKIKEDIPINKTIYQFGGGEQRISSKTINLPAQIGDMEMSIAAEVVDADIPLLIGSNSLEKSKAVLDFGELKAKFFSTIVPLMKVGTGHFCISLISSKMSGEDTPIVDEEEVVLLARVEETEGSLNYKELQKLHHLCGHTASTDKLLKVIVKAGRANEKTKENLLKIKETCESCQRNSKLKP